MDYPHQLDKESKIEMHFAFEYDVEKDRWHFTQGGGSFDAGTFTDYAMKAWLESDVADIACVMINQCYFRMEDDVADEEAE
jgi:hypothetical protein